VRSVKILRKNKLPVKSRPGFTQLPSLGVHPYNLRKNHIKIFRGYTFIYKIKNSQL
jgi:hypothetical protein